MRHLLFWLSVVILLVGGAALLSLLLGLVGVPHGHPLFFLIGIPWGMAVALSGTAAYDKWVR